MTRNQCANCIHALDLPRQTTQAEPGGPAVPDLSKSPEIMCRRYPPTFITAIDPQTRAPVNVPQWPKLTADCWCGEFSSRPQEPTQ